MTTASASFAMRRRAVKAYPGARSNQRKWLRAVEQLGERWIVCRPRTPRELNREVITT